MKRWLIISTILFGVLALVVTLGFVFGGEYIAQRYVLPRVAERLGAELTWGGVSSSFGEVVLEDLRIGLPDVPEVRTVVGSLRVRYALWSLLSGRLQVEEVIVDALRVEVTDLDRDLMRRIEDQLARVARRGEQSLDGAGGSPAALDVRLIDGEIHARLAGRPVVLLEDIDGVLGIDGRFDFRVGAVRIMGEPSGSELAMAGPVLVSGRREGGRALVVTDLAFEGFSFRWTIGDGPDELEDVLRQLRGIASEAPHGDEPQSDGGVPPANALPGNLPDAGPHGRIEDAGPGPDADPDEDTVALPDAAGDAGSAPTGSGSARADRAPLVAFPGSITVAGGSVTVLWRRREDALWQVGLADVEGEVFLGSDGEPPLVRLRGFTRPGDGRIVLSGTLDPAAPSLRARVSSLRIAHLTDGISLEGLQFDTASVLDGDLSISLGPDHVVVFEGEIETNGLTVRSDLLASEPLEDLRVRAVASGRLQWPTRAVEVREARLWINGVEMQLEGQASRTEDHTTVDLRVALASVPCVDLLRATPGPLRDRIGDLDLEGVIGGRFQLTLDTRRLQDTVLELNLSNGCRATGRGALAIERLQGAFWHRVELPGDETFEFRTGPGSGSWASLEQISPFMVAAVLTSEDGGFFYHHGFSLREIRNALIRDVEAGGPRFGASTITMQLARNLFLYRGRTLARKIQEAVLTWYLEQHLSKEEILALYLNVIEFGPEVFGVRAAAMHYFGRQPDDLSPREAVFLAKLLPAPVARHEETYEEGELSPRWESRLDRVLRLMRERRSLTPDEYREALVERISFHRPGDPLPPHRTWRRRISLPRGSPEDDSPSPSVRGADGEAYIPAPAELVDDLNGW